MGEDIEGSMKRVLSEKRQKREHSVATSFATQLDGFEYVSSIGLYVGKQKELHNQDWNEAKSELHNRGDRMPTTYEFVEFINHLKGKNDAEANTILDEIYKVEGDWRSEWLDARFVTQGKSLAMKYYEFDNSGKIVEKNRILRGILKKDKTPGISLDSWLSNNVFGLPKSDAPAGDLYYWSSVNGAVAGFDANSGRAVLDCNGDPDGRYASLGVRAVRRASQ